MIILDISANTHKNNWNYLKRMLDELNAVDTGKHAVVIKHQLFKKAGDNIPLKHGLFDAAYRHAEKLGYRTTSSVFDSESLEFLLKYKIPFVKIANNRSLDYLIKEVPRGIPVIVSVDDHKLVGEFDYEPDTHMFCVSNYPATIKDYEDRFSAFYLYQAISDHTTNFDLYKKHNPQIIEWHYKLEDSTGLDAGAFARTPEQLREVL
jgi:sialic acid synthase SpsE